MLASCSAPCGPAGRTQTPGVAPAARLTVGQARQVSAAAPRRPQAAAAAAGESTTALPLPPRIYPDATAIIGNTPMVRICTVAVIFCAAAGTKLPQRQTTPAVPAKHA